MGILRRDWKPCQSLTASFNFDGGWHSLPQPNTCLSQEWEELKEEIHESWRSLWPGCNLTPTRRTSSCAQLGTRVLQKEPTEYRYMKLDHGVWRLTGPGSAVSKLETRRTNGIIPGRAHGVSVGAWKQELMVSCLEAIHQAGRVPSYIF